MRDKSIAQIQSGEKKGVIKMPSAYVVSKLSSVPALYCLEYCWYFFHFGLKEAFFQAC